MTDPSTSCVPPPPHLTVRLPRYVDGDVDPADLDAAEALLARCDIAAVGERDSGREEVAGMFSSASTDREHSAFVLDGDDIVGYVWIEQDATAAETWVDAYADPSPLHPRGRRRRSAARDPRRPCGSRGHRTRRRLERAQRIASAPTAPWSTGCRPQVSSASAGSTGCGSTSRRPRSPDAAPPLPDGVVLVNASTEDERRRLYAVQQESFADHWNHTAAVVRRVPGAPRRQGGDDPDGWWLLEVDGVPAAVCILDESRADLGDGYVRTLGVARDFRGRGLAQLLLTRAFLHYRERGRAGVQLGVDSSSPTGADKLYRKVGMAVTRELDAWSYAL